MLKLQITNELYEYVLEHSIKENQFLQEIQTYNKSLANGIMQIPPEQGQFMALLAKITYAKKYLEIGVFTGYSSLIMAEAMGPKGKVYALDSNQEILDTALSFWRKAQVEPQIIPICGNALESLANLCTHEHPGTFDIAFIDANKNDYRKYFEYCYRLVKSGGIILIDNVLMQGKVIETPAPNYAKAIHEFNQFIFNDKRVEISLLPIADGLTIARKI